ncbi:peptidase M48-like protein [Azorhizobium sp. AG788]|uniref:M48 family metalloprotease n=1 Tax=Azorhizobium sp. AG788 TaxID=2183897 RepID=UPI001060D26A|nr:M48 family metallopeptidase [Azorhizobium sp. AG788]TDT90414.1 peptidase M48-like protein [Azorhizobium sp. AG788]
MDNQPIPTPTARMRALLILFAATILLPAALIGLGYWEHGRVSDALAQAQDRRDRMAGMLQQLEARQKPGAGIDYSIRFMRGGQTFVGPLAISEARKTLDYLDEGVLLEEVRQPLPMVAMVSAAAVAALSVLAILTAVLLGRAGRASRDMLVAGFSFARRMLRPLLLVQVVLGALALIAVVVFEALPFVHGGGREWGLSDGNGAKLFALGVAIAGVAAWTAFKTFVRLRRAVQVFDPDPMPIIGHTVSRAEAPGLWGLVDDLAGRLGALKPDNVVVGLAGGFFVSSGPKVLRPDDTRLSGNTLYLPLPYLALLREDEVATIIGHELAHFSGGDTQYSLRFVPLYAGVSRSLEAVALAGMTGDGKISPFTYPAFQLGVFVLNQFDGAVLHWSRKREFEADAAGARVTSNEAGARALLRTLAVEPRINEVLEAAHEDPDNAPADLVAFTVDHVADRGAEDPSPHLDKRQPHPTDTHPPTVQRIAALGREVTPAALAEAVAPPAPGALSRLSAYFADPAGIARTASARFVGTVRQNMQAQREALQALADEVQAEPVPLHENTRPGAIFLFVFGGLFVAAAAAVAVMGRVPGFSVSETQLLAGLAGGMGLIFMLFGIPLLLRSRKPCLILERDALVHPGLDRPIVWTDISGTGYANDRGALVINLAIGPDAPFPAKVRGARRIKVKPKQRLITIKAVPPRKLKARGMADLIEDYIRAAHARRILAEDARLSA